MIRHTIVVASFVLIASAANAESNADRHGFDTARHGHGHGHGHHIVIINNPTPPTPLDWGIGGGVQNIVGAPRKVTPQMEDAWQARCKPERWQDRDGIMRFHYAEPDCDLSRP